MALYTTTASHLAFVERSGLRGLLLHCGLPSDQMPTIINNPPTAPVELAVNDGEPEGSAEPSLLLLEPGQAISANLNGNDGEFNVSVEAESMTDKHDVVTCISVGPPRTPIAKERTPSPQGCCHHAHPYPLPPRDIRRAMPDVNQEDLARGIKSVVRFKCYTLQSFKMTLLNHLELHRFCKFFSVPYEPRRGNNRLHNEQTIAKSRKRICGFLGWLKQSGRFTNPSFVNFEDIELFLTKYVEGYLRSIRELNHGSIGNHLTSAINVLKYRSAAPNVNPKANPKIAQLMRARNQEQVLAERQQRDGEPRTSVGIVWEQVLEAVRRQRFLVEQLWGLPHTSPESSYELAVQEVWLLLDRILTWSESRESQQNHITTLHGRYIAVISDYKNKHHWGKDMVELPGDKEILSKYLLWLMSPSVRQQITCGANHGFLVCKKSGEAFVTAAEWNTYLSGIIEAHTGVPGVGPNALQHAFTTFLETSTDEDHLRLRKSVGRAMRHTSRIQQTVYNDISPLDRKRKGVNFASRAFKKVVIDHESGNKSEQTTSLIGSVVGLMDEQNKLAFGKL
ncbi:hypothetical protein DFJ77DRAFT_549731 [Powellomyces hirtus]|nr:hypothetical protein DFJ77DRAFT_549731 [Powellomyces hirtus]